MFKTLLLATVAGAGAANIPAAGNVERSYYPPSHLCSSTTKKCSQAKQVSSISAYCSSYLNVPKTATKTVTKCTTTLIKSTLFTGTITVPGTTITNIVTGCARPTTAPAAVAPPAGGDSAAPAPEGKRDVEPEAELEKRYGIPKPSCLAAYTRSKDISSACSCLGLQPKATTTRTITDVKTSVRIVKTVSTATGAPTTASVFSLGPAPTFALAKDSGELLIFDRDGESPKFIRSGIAEKRSSNLPAPIFQSGRDLDAAILFKLNNPGGLSGNMQIEQSSSPASGFLLSSAAEVGSVSPSDYGVRFDDPAMPGSPPLRPLTCSLSFNPLDGTCPLDCQVLSADDSNQVLNGSRQWFLAEPGAVSDNVYRTFAVTREATPAADSETDTNSPQTRVPDVRGPAQGGSRKRDDLGVSTEHGGIAQVQQNQQRDDLGVPTGHGGATKPWK